MTATLTEAPSGASLPNCGETCPIAMEAIGGETNDERRLKLAVIAVTSGRATQTFAAQEWKVPQSTLSGAIKEALAQGDQVIEPDNLIASGGPSAESDQVIEPDNLITSPAPKVKGKDGKAQPIVNYSDATKATALAMNAAGESQRAIARHIGCTPATVANWLKKAVVKTDAPEEPIQPAETEEVFDVEQATGLELQTQTVVVDTPKRPERYSNELKRIRRILKLRTDLEGLLKEAETLSRQRPGDAEGTLAEAPDWHQSVVAYIEHYEPDMAQELGIEAKKPRFLIEAMDDLERLGFNASGKIHRVLIEHGYQPTHKGKTAPQARFDWTTK